MLRRRFLASAIKLLRTHAQMTINLFHKVKTAAISVPAMLAELKFGITAASKADSALYDASLSNLDTAAAASPSLDADKYEAALSSNDSRALTEKSFAAVDYDVTVAKANTSAVIIEEGLEPTPFNSALAKAKKEQAMLISPGAVAVGNAEGVSAKIVPIEIAMGAQESTASVGDSTKKIEIDSLANALGADSTLLDVKRVLNVENKTEPLSGDANLSNLDVYTTTSPYMEPDEADSLDAHLDVYAAVSPSIEADCADPIDASLDVCAATSPSLEPDLAEPNLSLFNNQEVGVGAEINGENIDAADANTSNEISMLTTFAPFAFADNERFIAYVEDTLTEILPEDFGDITVVPSNYVLWFPYLLNVYTSIEYVEYPDSVVQIGSYSNRNNGIACPLFKNSDTEKTIHIVYPANLEVFYEAPANIMVAVFDFSKAKKVPRYCVYDEDGNYDYNGFYNAKEIRVPSALYDEWKNTVGWKTLGIMNDGDTYGSTVEKIVAV